MYNLIMSGTVLGSFIQVLPVSILASFLYVVIRYIKIKNGNMKANLSKEIIRTIFVCYLTGLISLVLVPFNFWSVVWGYIYNGYSVNSISFLNGSFNLIPSVFKLTAGELELGSWVKTMLAGNVLMFVPFGLLLPLAFDRINKHVMLGLTVVIPLFVEIVQILVGRSFDTDDLICNFIGIIAGYLIYLCVATLLKRSNKTK